METKTMPEQKSINEILEDLGLPGAADRATAPDAIKSVFAAIATVINPDSSEDDQRAAAANCLEVTGNSDMLVIAGLQSDSLRVAEETENIEAEQVDAEAAYHEELQTAELAHQEAMQQARENLNNRLNPVAEETPIKESIKEQLDAADGVIIPDADADDDLNEFDEAAEEQTNE